MTAKRLFGWVCVLILALINWFVVEIVVQSAWIALLVLIATTIVVLSPIGAWFTARSMGGADQRRQKKPT